jgi:hypothetical protein
MFTHGGMHQQADFAAQLGGDAVGTFEITGRHIRLL